MAVAENETYNLELEVDALVAAKNLDIDMAEAVYGCSSKGKFINFLSLEPQVKVL